MLRLIYWMQFWKYDHCKSVSTALSGFTVIKFRFEIEFCSVLPWLKQNHWTFQKNGNSVVQYLLKKGASWRIKRHEDSSGHSTRPNHIPSKSYTVRFSSLCSFNGLVVRCFLIFSDQLSADAAKSVISRLQNEAQSFKCPNIKTFYYIGQFMDNYWFVT